MKKMLKTALLFAGALAVPASINSFIFKLNEIKILNNTIEENSFFNWTYGKIRYMKCGKGKPLLLIHSIGVGGSMAEFKKSISILSHRYTVYAIDLLGFGYSDKPNISYSSYLYSQLINDFISIVIKQKTYVIASSYSAAFALAAHCINPRFISKLLLVSPVGAGTTSKRVMAKDLLIKKIIEIPIIGTTIYNYIASKCSCVSFLERFGYSDLRKVHVVVQQCYDAAHYGGANTRLPIAAFLSNYLTVDIDRLAEKTSIPVHCIWGKKNKLNPISNFEFLREKNSSFSIAEFEEAMLFPHDENVKRFYRECYSFFG